MYSSNLSFFFLRKVRGVKAPLQVAIFVWIAALGKVLTLNNSRKRNVVVVEWCCMCKNSGESINHLLICCEVAREL
jgi:hypothetical protein